MTVVYTAILGACDSLKPAPRGADRCVCFVDDPAAYSDAKGWTLVAHRYAGDPRREAWRLRCVPHALFHDATRTAWVDASFTVTDLAALLRDAGDAPVSALRHHRRSSCYDEAAAVVKVNDARPEDVRHQMAAYRAQGFAPEHLSISCIVVRDASPQALAFGETWQREIAAWPCDITQLSLDYSAWANGFSIVALRGTRHANPYSVHDHLDHKKRRKPYLVPA